MTNLDSILKGRDITLPTKAAETSYPTSEVRGSGRDELPNGRGQGWRPRRATPSLGRGQWQRRATPRPSSQGYGFSSGHVWM